MWPLLLVWGHDKARTCAFTMLAEVAEIMVAHEAFPLICVDQVLVSSGLLYDRSCQWVYAAQQLWAARAEQRTTASLAAHSSVEAFIGSTTARPSSARLDQIAGRFPAI